MSTVNPYAPPQAAVSHAAGGEHAGRLARLCACLIDFALSLATNLPIVVFRYPALAPAPLRGVLPVAADPLGTVSRYELWAILGPFLILIVVQAVLLARTGQTIGKRALGVRIVKKDGGPASLARIVFLRVAIPYIVGSLLPLYYLVDWLLIFNSSRRCLHDFIAGTSVVKA